MKEMKIIIEYLEHEYLKSVDRVIVNDFKKWIIDCSIDSVDSQRLLCCIAIDTKYKLVEKQQYADIFNEMEYVSSLKPQLIFEDTLNKDNGRLHCSSKHFQSQLRSKHIYSSIVKLSTFTFHYLDRNKHLTADEIHQVRDRLMDGEFIEIIIAKSAEKPREVSWVTLLSKIDGMIEYAINNNLVIADYLCERLGLYRNHMGTLYDEFPEYVKLIYPKNIDEIFYQPLAINADWKSEEGLYLSYKKDDYFGRTRNLTFGDLALSIQEQVHFKINKEYTYSAQYIGKTKKSIKNVSTIVNDGFRRFKGKKH